MKDKNVKNINVDVNYEVWKKIKILSVQRDATFKEQVVQLLERSVSNKKIETITEE